jgi:hypothetical protein
MIRLKVFETGLNEVDLLLRLIGRGRQADVPYYFSVDSYDLEKGWVLFTRLDCAPAPSFRVGVAGSNLIISMRDEHHLINWLNGWGIKFQETEIFEAISPDIAHAHLSEMRKKVVPKSKRKLMLSQLRESINKLRSQEEKALLKYYTS